MRDAYSQMPIAIGSPLGLVGGPTVTAGVISALNRSIQTESTFMEGLIQTDAAIIPFAQGIGFAIPIQPAMWIAEQLREHGEIVRPWMSMNAIDVNPKMVA